MVKHHVQYHYLQYVPVSLDIIDPNNEVPDWDLNTKPTLKESSENEFKGSKRVAENSPEGSLARKKRPEGYINDWKIAEFLEAYINGTATAPNYVDSDWLEREAQNEYGHSNTTYNVEGGNDHIDHNSNDDLE